MLDERKTFYQKIEQERNSKVIAYITGDRPGLETQIGADVPDILIEHLDTIGRVRKISLLLYTLGGNTLAAWNIVNLIREFCDELEVIVPNKCRSAGTLIALGANRIVMTKQATLGPIDPSLTSAMGPIIPGSNPERKLPISVESVKGYFSLLKEELGAKSDNSLSSAYNKLTEYIHPLVLGDVYRTQKQIQMLAEKLLAMSYNDRKTIKSIVSFLCSDSGSHDYTISRTEAKKMGLNIESPTQEIYSELKEWHRDFSDELELSVPYTPLNVFLKDPSGKYLFKRCLIESVEYGQDALVAEGQLVKSTINDNGNQQTHIANNVFYEGWRHF